MLDIRIDGQSANFIPGTNVVLERFSPLFDFGALPGSLVYGFNLPITPVNQRIFGFFDQDQVSYTNRTYRCDKYADSQVIEQGFVKIHEVKNEYNLYFTQNLNEAFGDYQQMLLSSINFGAEPVPANPVLAANHLTDKFCFPTIENPGFYGNQGVGNFNGKINDYDTGTSTYVRTALVPQFFLKWVMKQYGQLTGWSFTGDFWDHPDMARLLLMNLYSLDQAAGSPAATILYQNHLPDLTMPQLLVALRQLLNLFIEFDVRRKVCTISFGDQVMRTGLVVDWTAKAAPDGLKTPDLNNRLELSWEIDSNDALMKPIPADFDQYVTPITTLNAGGAVIPIKSRLSSLLTNPATGRAMTSQAGTSPNNKDSTARGLPKLLFWNGVVGGYPTATNAQGSYRLAWHGANNLVSTGYSQFERFKETTFALKKQVYLTPADLALFSFRNRVYIQGVQYWVGSLKASLGDYQRAVLCEVDLWRA